MEKVLPMRQAYFHFWCLYPGWNCLQYHMELQRKYWPVSNRLDALNITTSFSLDLSPWQSFIHLYSVSDTRFAFITIKTHPPCVGFIVFSLLTSRYFASQFRLMWVANITEKEPQGVVNLKSLFLKHRLLTKRQANCMVSSNATPFKIIISRERLFHVLALRKDRRTW